MWQGRRAGPGRAATPHSSSPTSRSPSRQVGSTATQPPPHSTGQPVGSNCQAAPSPAATPAATRPDPVSKIGFFSLNLRRRSEKICVKIGSYQAGVSSTSLSVLSTPAGPGAASTTGTLSTAGGTGLAAPAGKKGEQVPSWQVEPYG